jgi:hypothetical protein
MLVGLILSKYLISQVIGLLEISAFYSKIDIVQVSLYRKLDIGTFSIFILSNKMQHLSDYQLI